MALKILIVVDHRHLYEPLAIKELTTIFALKISWFLHFVFLLPCLHFYYYYYYLLKTPTPLPSHSIMKKNNFNKKLTPFPSSFHMSNEGQKKTLTSTPSPSTRKEI
jgi:hypothetical protein